MQPSGFVYLGKGELFNPVVPPAVYDCSEIEMLDVFICVRFVILSNFSKRGQCKYPKKRPLTYLTVWELLTDLSEVSKTNLKRLIKSLRMLPWKSFNLLIKCQFIHLTLFGLGRATVSVAAIFQHFLLTEWVEKLRNFKRVAKIGILMCGIFARGRV